VGGISVGEVDGPHLLPQPDQLRVAVPGKRLKDGATATLIVIYCPEQRAWVFYIDSNPRQAVIVPVSDVDPVTRLLGAGPQREGVL
jgi:hypothetical protein